MMPPAGGDQSLGSTINVTVWSFVAVPLFPVVTWLFACICLTSNVGRDGFWILLSMVSPWGKICMHQSDLQVWQLFSLIFAGIASAAIAAGCGRYVYYLGLPATSEAVWLEVIADWFVITSVALPKLAVACLYTRLLNPAWSHEWILHGPSVSDTAKQTTCAILLFTQCTPLQGLWDLLLNLKCWSSSVLIEFSVLAGCE